MTKTCSRCKTDKPFDAFDARKGKKDGLRAHCKECRRQDRIINREKYSQRWKARYQQIKDLPETKARQKASYLRHKPSIQAYNIAHRERENERRREQYPQNRDEILAQQKIFRDQNPEVVSARRKAHRQANLETMRVKERTRQKARRARDVQFRLKANLRTRINHAMKNRSESSQDLLGCSMEHYIKHIESQFQPGMTWENYATYWQIDHIRPCASFDLSDPIQQRECFHWTNCQPLTKTDNCRKATKTGLEAVYKPSPNPLSPCLL